MITPHSTGTPSSPSTGPAPIRVPALSPERVNEYSALFDKSGAENGVLSGLVAKQIFERARLPNEVLGKIWGLFGIYIATSFARMLTNTWYIPYAVFKHGLKRHPMEYFRQYLIYAFVLIIDGGVCYLFCSLCQFSYLVNTLVKIVICSIVPNIMFWVFFHKTEEFMFLKDKFIELFRRMGKRKKSS